MPQFLQVFSKVTLKSSVVTRWLQAVLLVSLAWLAGAFAMQFLQQPIVPALPSVKIVPIEKAAEGQASLLFGQPKSTQLSKPLPPVTESEARETRLNLKLIGLIGLGEQGVALIEASGKSKVISVGETIQTGVTLLALFDDGVLLSNKGRQEKLLLPQAKQSRLLSTQAESSMSDMPTTSLNVQQQSKLNEIGDKLKKSPMAISQYIRFQPLNSGGQWVGVKLWSKKDKALYRALGFAEGDILKEVNGKTIQEMASNPELWKAFLNQSQFDLVVERKGVPESISVNLNP